MRRRCKVSDDVMVMSGVHMHETGQVRKLIKKRCYYYSEQLHRVVWCSVKNVEVLDPNKVYQVQPGGSSADIVEIGVRRVVHGNNIFMLW
jgi:hypothetical protein